MTIIDRMNLAGFDLNLLLVFDALLRERNVTRAGERLGLSQPAVSAALGRLRHAFGDELFVRRPGEMVPTSRALALAEPIRSALERLERAVAPDAAFDPASATLAFTLLCPDYFPFVTVPSLLARLRRDAPGVELRVLDASCGAIVELLGDGRADLAADIASDQPPEIRSAFLMQERYVCIARVAHAEIEPLRLDPDAPLPLDLYCRLPHALRSVSGSAEGAVDAALAAIGRRRRVVVTLPHFSAVALAVAGSGLIAAVPERLAEALAPNFGLEVRPLPVELAPLNLLLYWHARRDADPAHAWLRERIVACAVDLRGRA